MARYGFHPVLQSVALGLLVAAPLTAQRPLYPRVSETLARVEAEMIEVRRDLHRHPELSLQEHRTADVVAARLQKLGLEVRTGVGGTGVVGVLRGGRPGPVVAYRADMDAVRSMAPDPAPFPSENDGVRHICGHDIHTTVGLALAAGLASVRSELAGTVQFIFQPAEESVQGARAMLDAGVFSTPPAAIVGLHTVPLPVGQLATMPGTMMAWRDQAEVRITGDGAVDRAADSVVALLRALGNVPPAEILMPRPPGFRFVQVIPGGRSEGGRTVAASISAADMGSSTEAKQRLEAAVGAIDLPGVSLVASYQIKSVPGVVNDSAFTRAAIASVRHQHGDSAVTEISVITPAFSEDYGAFEALVPGVFFYLGVGPQGMPHSPGYLADEAAILFGARAMAAVVLDRLGHS